MTTTIAIQEDTLEMLKELKAEKQESTYDQAIRGLLNTARKPVESMYGKLKGKNDFKRDKSSRF